LINEIIDDIKKQFINTIKKEYNKDISNEFIRLEFSSNPKYGEIVSPFALEISKIIKIRPMDIGNKIVSNFSTGKYIDRIELHNPGHINIHFNQDVLTRDLIIEIFNKKSEYGFSNVYDGNTMLIEHTSINPTGPINIGRARNPLIGDTLVRLHKAVGWKVLTHYYVNNMGKQIAIIVWGLDSDVINKFNAYYLLSIKQNEDNLNEIKEIVNNFSEKEKMIYHELNINNKSITRKELISKYKNREIEDVIDTLIENEILSEEIFINHYNDSEDELINNDIIERYNKYKDKPEFQLFFTYVLANKFLNIEPGYMDFVDQLLQKCEKGEEDIVKKMEEIAKFGLKGQIETLGRLNVYYDSFDFESDFVLDGSVAKVINLINDLPESKILDDGARAVDLGNYGIQKQPIYSEKGKDLLDQGMRKEADKEIKGYLGTIYQRSNGTSVYSARDVAYHFWKLKLADRAITVLGEDHKIEFLEVKTLLKLLGRLDFEDQLNVVHLSFVSMKGKKMSTRRGITVPLDNLIDEGIELAYNEIKKRNESLKNEEIFKIATQIGVGAIKYNLIKIHPMKMVTFSWDDALNFNGESSPYIQYAHARATRILEKSGIDDFEKLNLAVTTIDKNAFALVFEILKYPQIVLYAAENNRPHDIAEYSYKLAKLFTKFYHTCPVIKEEDPDLKNIKLSLVYAAKQTIKNSLELIGIEAPEKM